MMESAERRVSRQRQHPGGKGNQTCGPLGGGEAGVVAAVFPECIPVSKSSHL